MGRLHVFGVSVLSLVVASCGAAARLYQGAPLPPNRVSGLDERDLRVFTVDFAVAPEVARLEVLPGDHMLMIGRSHPLMTDAESRMRVRLCLRMLGGHAYLMRPIFSGSSWSPEIIDENTQTVVPTWSVNPAEGDCSPGRPPNPPPVLSAVPRASSALPDAPLESTAPSVAPETNPAAPVAPVPAAPSPPPPPVRAAVDSEAPRRPRHRLEQESVVTQPGTGFGLGIGLAGGGDKVGAIIFQNGSSDDLNAGEGLILNVSVMATPLWTSENVGFGLGGEFALKYQSVGGNGGSLTFTRFPFIAFGQMVARTGPRGSFLLRAGLEWDLAPNVSGDGIASGLNLDLSSNAGFVGDIGVWYQSSNRVGLTAIVRLTRLSYSIPGTTFDATNVALMLGLVLDPR